MAMDCVANGYGVTMTGDCDKIIDIDKIAYNCLMNAVCQWTSDGGGDVK